MDTSFADSSATFPQKLYALMEFEEGDVVHWAPHGFAFVVTDQEKFLEEIVPRYFKHTKLTSFQRQLNLYGFRRLTKGEDQGAYFHPRFQRGRKDLIPEIKRLPPKGSLPTLEQVMNACKQLPSERFGGVRGKKGTGKGFPGSLSNNSLSTQSSYGNNYMGTHFPMQMGMYGASTGGMMGNVDGMNNYGGFNPYFLPNYQQLNPYYQFSHMASNINSGIISDNSQKDGKNETSDSSGSDTTVAPYTKSKLTMNIGFSNGQVNPGAMRMGAGPVYPYGQLSGAQGAASYADQFRMGWSVPVSSNFSNEVPINGGSVGEGYNQSLGYPPNPALAPYYYYQLNGNNFGHQQKEEHKQNIPDNKSDASGTADDAPSMVDHNMPRNSTFEDIEKLGILDVFAPENVDTSATEEAQHESSEVADDQKDANAAAPLPRNISYVPSFDEAMGAAIQSPSS